jgi:hypothetical protein
MDETEDGDTSDDNEEDDAENHQADRGPGAVLAEQMKDEVETEAVVALPEIDSDNSKHKDAEAN